MVQIQGSDLTFCYEGSFDNIFKAILRQLDLERIQFEKRMEQYSEGKKENGLRCISQRCCF